MRAGAHGALYRSAACDRFTFWLIGLAEEGILLALITGVALLTAVAAALTARGVAGFTTEEACEAERIKQRAPTRDKVLLNGTEERRGGPVNGQASR